MIPLRLVPDDEPAAETAVVAATMRAPIEPEIVVRAAAGDERAFAELVTWYYPRFLRFATHMLRDESDAEDAVQEAFVRVYRALPGYQDQGRLEPWLFRILANRCRTAASRRRPFERIGLWTREARTVSTRASDDDVALRDMIAAALETLPPDQREAFVLHYVEGYSYDTMTEITGVTTSALKMRAKRACDRVRAKLEGVYHA